MQYLSTADRGLIEVEVSDQHLILHPFRAVFWPTHELLIVTDLHLGKIQHFRNSGIYVPSHASLDNYERLSGLLLEFLPKSLLILGDLFHSDYNHDWQNFCELRNSFPEIRFELVPGNHDIIDRNLFLKNDVHLHENGHVIDPFQFSHYPEKVHDLYNIAGHIHPGIRLVGHGLQSLKLPVFYFGVHQALLPSFGTFTGISLIQTQPGDQVVAISDETLVRINNPH